MLGPKHTAADVAFELEQGLRNGTILLRDDRESPVVEERKKTPHFMGELEIAAVLGTLLFGFWAFHQGIDDAVAKAFQKLTAPVVPTAPQVKPR